MNGRQKMREFVQGSGGRVRFDKFAREHLMNPECGFYSRKADIARNPAQVCTPSRLEEYVVPLSLFVSGVVMQRSQAIPRGRPVVFAEIGGGSGSFKKAFLEHWEFYNSEGLNRRIEYISIDPNPNHRASQSFAGKVAEGTAQGTGLPGRSVDVLFDDEVMDCMPFRIAKFDKKDGRISYEAFVKAENGGLRVFYDSVEYDEGVRFYERHLKGMGGMKGDCNWSEDYGAYWKESHRVLVPGGLRLSADYSTDTMPTHQGQGQCQAISEPYDVDLTHFVDFPLQAKIAKMNGFMLAEVEEMGKAISSMWGGASIHCFGRKMIAAIKG